jgi:hypothetical protein
MSCSECNDSKECYLCHGTGETTPGILESIGMGILSPLGDDDDASSTCAHCNGSGDCPACED